MLATATAARSAARRALLAAAAARPSTTVFALCIDGSDPRYIAGEAGRALAPALRALAGGFVARAAMPTFTNVNNVSIITASPPSAHGIAGNYLYDEARRAEVSMVEPAMVRAPSLLAEAHEAGFDVVVVTAKDKLVRLLRLGLPAHAPSAAAAPGSGFDAAEATVTVVSMESAAAADAAAAAASASAVAGMGAGASAPSPEAALVRELLLADAGAGASTGFSAVGGRLPTIYDPLCSVAAVAAGGALVSHLRARRRAAGLPQRPALAYLSTTDFVQHKHAPFSPGADAFYAALDGAVAALRREHAGCVLGLTADHGMSAKHDAAGAPRIAFLGAALRAAGVPARVVLPITDAHVVHHASLGGFAVVHVGAEHAEGAAAAGAAAAAGGAAGAAPEPFGDGWRPVGAREVLPPGLEISMDLGADGGSGGGGRFARLAGGGARRAALVERAAAALRALPGVLRVLPRAVAAAVYELPADRLGDLVVVADEEHVLGKDAAHHDLSQVAFLRSHGGESELAVSFLLSHVPAAAAERLAAGEARNFDLLPLLFEAAAEAAGQAEGAEEGAAAGAAVAAAPAAPQASPPEATTAPAAPAAEAKGFWSSLLR